MKIGDMVFIDSGDFDGSSAKSIEQIESETSDFFVTATHKFNKQTHRIMGSSYSGRVELATDKHFGYFARIKILRKLSRFDFEKLSSSELSIIMKIIQKSKKQGDN